MWRTQTGGWVCGRHRISILLITLGLIVAPLFVAGARARSEEEEPAPEKAASEAQEPTAEPDPYAWNFAGDFRLRYEQTTNQEAAGTPDRTEPRNRGVVRFRGQVTKKLNRLFDFGVRLTTGNPDDPNSSDITLGDFVDDLTVSLDRAYLGFNYEGIILLGGKFPNPFLRTDLVWDGDVNPQGGAGTYSFSASEGVTPKFSGIYFIVDETTAERDSYMAGGQAEALIQTVPDWSIRASAGYYDYTINSLFRADSGDIRGNRTTRDGAQYVSDFNMLDVIAIVDYRGFGPRYPVRFVLDHVTNFGVGANVPNWEGEDSESGLMLDWFVGPLSKQHDVRFRYGYSRAETDAILTAFSHDNTTYSTNYRQHTVTVDFLAYDNLVLNATWYLYQRLETDGPNPWIRRLRLNAMVTW